MPLIQIQLFEGRSEDVKREYAQAITEAAVKIMGCSAESVDVIYQDVKKSDWATAGKLWSDQSPEVVKDPLKTLLRGLFLAGI